MKSNAGIREFRLGQELEIALSGLYQLELFSNSNSDVIVVDSHMGSFVLPAGETRRFDGHPMAPFDVDLIFKFDQNANPNNDLVTMVYVQVVHE